MEPRIKLFLFWSGVVCLCFFGIPFHLKGEDREHLEATFTNYSREFNKNYSLLNETALLNFQKSLTAIQMLNQQQEDSVKLTMFPNLKSSGSGDGSEELQSLRNHIKTKKWKKGMPKNQGIASWGLTAFADVSPEQFKKQYLDPQMSTRISMRQKNKEHHHHHFNHNNNHDHEHIHLKSSGAVKEQETNAIDQSNPNLVTRKRRATTSTIPTKVDWRTKNIVTPIRHQQACGACWAFSTVETVESMNSLKTGKLQVLSVQQVIDCSKNGNMGCNGGDTCAALEWMSGNKLVEENKYPLTLKDGTCALQASALGVAVNSNYTCDSYVDNENELLQILANHGPVAAAVDATNWQYYVGGIIQFNCESNNNHAVQIVGYDQTATPPHYIVRNSWGTEFGDKGYLYIAIGKNLCGIAREVSAVSVI